MARVHYVQCTLCQKEYYLDQMLFEVIICNPNLSLICPFCKKKFQLRINQDRKTNNELPIRYVK